VSAPSAERAGISYVQADGLRLRTSLLRGSGRPLLLTETGASLALAAPFERALHPYGIQTVAGRRARYRRVGAPPPASPDARRCGRCGRSTGSCAGRSRARRPISGQQRDDLSTRPVRNSSRLRHTESGVYPRRLARDRGCSRRPRRPAPWRGRRTSSKGGWGGRVSVVVVSCRPISVLTDRGVSVREER
jgi:hypothetical protein